MMVSTTGVKVEVKTNGSSHAGAEVFINWGQIRPSQDYEYLVGQIVTPQEVIPYVIPKADIAKLIAAGNLKQQHGGKAATNANTYIVNGKHPAWVYGYRTSWQALADRLRVQ